MALATDLMGLGNPPLLSTKTANAGNGPVTISAAGTAFASGTKIGVTQFLMSCTNADGTKVISLPTVGSDNGCSIGDFFVINNASSSTLNVYASTGVNISWGGSNANNVGITTHTTSVFFPITTTQWVGEKGT